MPRYNGLNTDRLENYARRLLGIRQGGIMPSLSPEPAVSINLPETHDLLGLCGAVPWGGGNIVAAVAAQFGAINIRNVSSSLLVTVRVMAGTGAAASTVVMALGNTGLGLAGVGATSVGWRDARRALASFPLAGAVAVEAGTLAAIPPAGYWNVAYQLAATSAMMNLGEVTLPPGACVVAWLQTANQSFYWSVEGTIRDALQDELESI